MAQAPDLESWSLYLVRLPSGALYTGIARDVERRFGEHVRGRGAKALRGKAPLELARSWEVGPRGRALRAEHRVKGLSKSQKEALLQTPHAFAQLLAELSDPG